MTIEILCRTNAGTINLDSTGGGRPELTASEVAGILHGESEGVYLTGMCYITGQVSEAKLSGFLYDEIKSGVIRVRKKREVERDKPIFARMCQLSVREAIGGNICPICRGTKHDENMKNCVTCNGTGHLNPTDNWRSEYCFADDWSYWKPSFNTL